MTKERYECKVGDASKFWEPEVRGKKLIVRFGKIGSASQTNEKTFASKAEATRERDRLVREKIKKGYVLVGGENGEIVDMVHIGSLDECSWDALVYMAKELTKLLKRGRPELCDSGALFENVDGVNIDSDILWDSLDKINTLAHDLGADRIVAFSDNELCYLMAVAGKVTKLQIAMETTEWGKEDFNDEMLSEYQYFNV